MKLLPLDYVHRNYLINRYALKLDADGNEILAGLSCSESAAYLLMFDGSTKGFFPANVDDVYSFLSMHERHTNELPPNLLFGMSYAMSQQESKTEDQGPRPAARG
jgi:hypothetical protein